jgi:tetratricopeptide (TPR) repeat protein
MSEDNRVFGVDTGGENASATDMALSGASRAKADAFLEDQRRHLHEQARHLREQLGLKLWELRMGVFLRLATLIVGLAVATGAGLMVWDAAHSKSLLIEPFSVPPDMAQRGLTGEVIATQMLDKLATMTATESSRAVQSYANNWGNNIKVEIPETGVSIGELERYLRGWLGHDIRISGEVYRTAEGIAVTARTGGDAGATYTGKESDLDALMKKAAEHVYEITQPYRFANYLDRNHDPNGAAQRVARATAIYRKLIAGDDPVERAWAWNGLGTIEAFWRSDSRQAAYYYRKAMASVPDFTIAYFALASRNNPLGQEEESFQNLREASRLLHRDSISDLNPHYAPYARLSSDSQIALAQGDFVTTIAIARQGAELPDDFSVLARGNYISDILSALARSHDGVAVRAYLRDMHWKEIPAGYTRGRIWLDMERQDWRDVIGGQASLAWQVAQAAGGARARGLQNAYESYTTSYALAHAHLGDFAGAEKLIANVAPDRDMGLRAHAIVAELQGQHARADWWFARSEKLTPSVPLTDLWWGQALLARGQPDAATEKFKLANKKGPHFADPIEMLGEALMAKNQSHLALAKFAEADKYAPNWGRLHLKWGEALAYAGKKDEAKAQFARAAQLDLTPSEKAELARQPPHA